MKKQIDGWAFRGDDGEWKMLHSDFGKVQYQMLEGNLGAGKIVEVRIIDASDDSKDVVVPRELLKFLDKVMGRFGDMIAISMYPTKEEAGALCGEYEALLRQF